MTLVLSALAVTLGFSKALTFQIAGFRPLAGLEARDLAAPETIEDLTAARFLQERDQVQVEILRDMTLGELIRLYQLAEQPHVRRQIAAQEGVPVLPDSHPLEKGKSYRITLTPPAPPAEGVEPPAATPALAAGGAP